MKNSLLILLFVLGLSCQVFSQMPAKGFESSDADLNPYLQSFVATMLELVQCAQLLEKPIEF